MLAITQELILHAWQKKNAFFYLVLVPLSWLFGLLTGFRRLAYQIGLFKSYALPVPVIVVGNINLGGSGKTPVVMWLVAQLKANGYKPAVISRGYGGSAKLPTSVNENSSAVQVGDEPLLIAKRSACPVWVGADRVHVGCELLKAHPECDVMISDDGLQHYALKREVEIAVTSEDSLNRGALNAAWILPAGPMREPASRLSSVDAIVCNSPKNSDAVPVGTYQMQLVGAQFYNLADPHLKAKAIDFKGKSVKAMAGIGKPERFFEYLGNLGLTFAGVSFDDHHAFTAADLAQLDCDILLMTEKDAVKCQSFAQAHHWVLPVEANIDEALFHQVLAKIAKK